MSFERSSRCQSITFHFHSFWSRRIEVWDTCRTLLSQNWGDVYIVVVRLYCLVKPSPIFLVSTCWKHTVAKKKYNGIRPNSYRKVFPRCHSKLLWLIFLLFVESHIVKNCKMHQYIIDLHKDFQKFILDQSLWCISEAWRCLWVIKPGIFIVEKCIFIIEFLCCLAIKMIHSVLPSTWFDVKWFSGTGRYDRYLAVHITMTS